MGEDSEEVFLVPLGGLSPIDRGFELGYCLGRVEQQIITQAEFPETNIRREFYFTVYRDCVAKIIEIAAKHNMRVDTLRSQMDVAQIRIF